jgi:hypothetical protein
MEERTEEGEGEEEERGSVEERRLVRMLVGTGIARRRRLRRLLLAHVLRERMDESGGGGEEGEEGEEGASSEEHRLARMLIGVGMVRRRRLRRLILAHLLRDRFEERGGAEEEEGGEESETGSGSDEDRRLVRMLIGRGMVRRARLRRLLMAQLLRDREETGAREYA